MELLLDFSGENLKNYLITYASQVLQNMNPYQLVAETIMAIFIIYLIFAKSYKPPKDPEVTQQEMDMIIDEWQPTPLFTPLNETQRKRDSQPLTISSAAGPHVIVNNKKCLNLVTANFLGFVGNPVLEESANKALHKYGVGSCGPRGFYGTIDIHVELEKRIAKFMGSESAILYSSGFCTITSVIPAFSKLGDIIICDEGASHAVQTGVKLSNSLVYYFKHNDMDSLELVLETVKKNHPETSEKNPKIRKFIVIEGLYYNYGDIAPLPRILELKEKFCCYLIMDESASVGVIGKTGRGICEHWGVSVTSIDMITATLGNAFASVGGFCVGTKVIVDHQRLNASGYVFSASLPPFLSTSAYRAFDMLDETPQLMGKLSIKTRTFRESLRGLSGLKVCGEEVSPVVHLRLENPTGNRSNDETLLQSIVDKVSDAGNIMLTRSRYTPVEKFLPAPSIRICISAAHDDNDLHNAANTLKGVCAATFARVQPATPLLVQQPSKRR